MKKLFVVLSLLVANISFAGDISAINNEALAVLLKTNPVISSESDSATVIDVITPWLSTLIDYENKSGSLQIVRNSCEAFEKGFKCTLSILSSDMTLTKKGNYVRPADATESMMMIDYQTNLSNDEIVGPVRLTLAG